MLRFFVPVSGVTFGFLFAAKGHIYAGVVSESLSYALPENWHGQVGEARAERRAARRFALEIPVLFSWIDDGQATCEGAGFCRDISTSGVFVVAFSAAPALSGKLEVVVLLPPFNPKAPTLRLHARGSVVRVEAMREGIGLGIASAFGDFESPDCPASSTSPKNAAIPCS